MTIAPLDRARGDRVRVTADTRTTTAVPFTPHREGSSRGGYREVTGCASIRRADTTTRHNRGDLPTHGQRTDRSPAPSLAGAITPLGVRLDVLGREPRALQLLVRVQRELVVEVRRARVGPLRVGHDAVRTRGRGEFHGGHAGVAGH